MTCGACTDAYANMAQLVEQRIRNAWVRGSSPLIGFAERGKPPVKVAVTLPGKTAIFVHEATRPDR